MNPGALRHRVTFQRRTSEPDGLGGVRETWEDVATAWAAVRPLSGDERLRAEQVRPGTSHEVTVRCDPRYAVTPDMRVVFAGRVFGIVEVRNLDEAGRELRITCWEVR